MKTLNFRDRSYVTQAVKRRMIRRFFIVFQIFTKIVKFCIICVIMDMADYLWRYQEGKG